MALLGLTDDTLLDLTVNLVPVGILLGLDVMFFVLNPWGWDLWFVFWMHALTLFPLALLLILTYVSGTVVQRDERRMHEADDDAQPAE